MWNIPDNQIVRIQNRISDIREVKPDEDPMMFIAATYELLGTLETIMFDGRNYQNKDTHTMIIDDKTEQKTGMAPEEIAEVIGKITFDGE